MSDAASVSGADRRHLDALVDKRAEVSQELAKADATFMNGIELLRKANDNKKQRLGIERTLTQLKSKIDAAVAAELWEQVATLAIESRALQAALQAKGEPNVAELTRACAEMLNDKAVVERRQAEIDAEINKARQVTTRPVALFVPSCLGAFSPHLHCRKKLTFSLSPGRAHRQLPQPLTPNHYSPINTHQSLNCSPITAHRPPPPQDLIFAALEFEMNAEAIAIEQQAALANLELERKREHDEVDERFATI
jgi:hypothetical protein